MIMYRNYNYAHGTHKIISLHRRLQSRTGIHVHMCSSFNFTSLFHGPLYDYVLMCVRSCVRACICACVRVCVRACVRAGVLCGWLSLCLVCRRRASRRSGTCWCLAAGTGSPHSTTPSRTSRTWSAGNLHARAGGQDWAHGIHN